MIVSNEKGLDDRIKYERWKKLERVKRSRKQNRLRTVTNREKKWGNATFSIFFRSSIYLFPFNINI